MQGKLAFGRRKLEEKQCELPSKSRKLAQRAECEQTCRAGACGYAAVVEASRFRAEATQKKKSCAAEVLLSSDLDTSLYDSFELDTFSSKLGHCLAEERRHAHVARQKSDLAFRWHPRRHSSRRRLSISCCAGKFPSCFPKRTNTIQLGKRKSSLQSALHVIAKVARRGCHVIAAIPTCTNHASHVEQPKKLQQIHHHYHHHLQHYTLQMPMEAQNHNEVSHNSRDDASRAPYEAYGSICNSHYDNPNQHEVIPSIHTLPYLPLEHLDQHFISIKYHS